MEMYCVKYAFTPLKDFVHFHNVTETSYTCKKNMQYAGKVPAQTLIFPTRVGSMFPTCAGRIVHAGSMFPAH